ncbi:MAG: hypothetical protein K2O78_03855 [Muribaculaceae bacterium]|nr:hypothetical protein [Muribaculaceae bacterium]MDE7080770.1 hypothetical protein [Muribaculaceae bacterium]
MKKIFTLMAGVAVCAIGYAAAPKMPEPVKVKSTASAEMLQDLRVEDTTAFYDVATKGDYTRTWTDAQGRVWDLQLNMYDESVGEFFGLVSADTDEPMTFDDLPYYPARYMLRRLSADQTSVVDGVIFYLIWPTYFIYDQIFTYDGEVDANGEIPADKRNYAVVPPSELLNNTRGCRTFTERPAYYVGGVLNDGYTAWSTFGMINNEWLGITALYNGAEATTVADGGTASTLVFSSYDLEDNSMSVRNRIFLKTASGATQTIANNFAGTAGVEGFEPRYVTNTFGDIHVFNTGLLNSKVLGDNNPFTSEEFDSVTAFYIAACDPVYEWVVNPSATSFNTNVVGLYLSQEGVTPTDTQANLMIGYAFGDPSYANDTSLDPKEIMFKLNEGEMAYAEELDQWYTKIYPQVNTFVTGGLAASWSEEFGMEVDNQASVLVLDGPQEFGWGTKDGFSASLRSQWSRYVTTTSTGNIIYHYDPTNVQLTRTFSSVGTLDASGVENVVAEGVQAQVVARDGMISVNAGEKAPIAIFTLDGKLVKAVEAENVAVEAAKGVYVVRVGEKATKVVL